MKYQKTYLSRAMTKAMSLDHPIGDPFGGPAFGEKRDPVSAVVAVSAMYMSSAGAAALVASVAAGGLAAATVGTVAAGLAFAGGAMSLVGNVTGNANLQRYGSYAMIAGAAGGIFDPSGFAGSSVTSSSLAEANATADPIGTLNQSQGWTATDAAGAAAPGAAAPGATTSQAPSVSEQIVGNPNAGVTVNAAPPQAVQPPTPISATEPLAPQPAAGAGGGFGSAAGSSAGSAASNPFLSESADVSGLMPGGSLTPQAPGAGFQPAMDNYFAQNPGALTTPPQTSMWDSVKSVLPDVSNWSTTDKLTAAKLGADVVGGVAQYAFPSDQQQATTQYYKSAADAKAAEAQKIQDELELRRKRLAQLNANMAMGLNMGAVNPNAVTFAQPTLMSQQPSGLISGARTA